MKIPPRIPFGPRIEKKRTFQTYEEDRRIALGQPNVKDVLLPGKSALSVRNNPRLASAKPSEPSKIKKSKLNELNMGPPINHFGSVDDLLRAHGNDYLPYGKPLVFLCNRERSIYVLARPYVMGWRAESNAGITRGEKRLRSLNLVAGMVHPKSLSPIDLGPVSERFVVEEKSQMFAVLMFPGGDNKDIKREEEFTLLAQCMYCFDVGRHVDADQDIARAMEKNLSVGGRYYGISLAMHHAAGSNDTEQALYFLDKGANPREIWDGNHRDSLEESLSRNNLQLISAFLEKMSYKDIEYLECLIRPQQPLYPAMGHIVEAKIASLSQRS